MAGKSIDDILRQQAAQRQAQIQQQQAQERALNEQRERQRQDYLQRIRMFESVSNSASSAAGAGGGGTPTQDWINGYDAPGYNTAWLYPQSDLDIAVQNMSTGLTSSLLGYTLGFTYSSVSFTKVDDYNYVFPTLQDVINFYNEMYAQTAVTQPLGNNGFSLGVGTIVTTRGNTRLKFKLQSGISIVEFMNMTQITSQSSLPQGGNSPDGTVGWGPIYVDWNADGVGDLPTDSIPNVYVDPIRFKPNI